MCYLKIRMIKDEIINMKAWKLTDFKIYVALVSVNIMHKYAFYSRKLMS